MKPITKLRSLLRKTPEALGFDRQLQRPVIRASICTGEQTAGFRNIHTGKFTDVMLIRTDRDLEEFQNTYGICADEIATEY